MKILSWFKSNPLIGLIILILAIWAGEKLFTIAYYMIMSGKVQPVYVETMVVKPEESTLRWQAVGTVKAAQNITVASEISGLVQSIDAVSSQSVQKDSVLINIKHDDIAANLQKDQAVFAQKQLYYQRLQRLLKASATSQESISEAMSEFQQAQAAVAADQAELNKYIIKAPFSGVLGIWQVDIGQLVKPGDPLVTLTQLSPAFIDFMLPAKALSSVAVGEDMQFTSMSYPDRVWKGQVIAIDPQLDNATRNIQLRAVIDNADGKLVPFLYGQAVVIKPQPKQLYIPQEAVIYDPQGSSVFVVNKGVANSQVVKLGRHEGDKIIVVDGLKAGDEVVTAGMMKLYPGAHVKVNLSNSQAS